MDEAETLIDYVLVYAEKSKLDFAIPKRIGIEKYSVQEKLEMRRGFLEHLQKEGKLEIVDQPVIETDGEMLTYVLIRAPFEVLCKEAERVKLRMPLAIRSPTIAKVETWHEAIDGYFSTEQEDEYYSEPFEWDNRHSFKDFDQPKKFFRQSLRSLLTYNILIGLNLSFVSEETEKHDVPIKMTLFEQTHDITKKRGLLLMLRNGVFKDAFALHDRPSAWSELFGKGSNTDVSSKIAGIKTERERLYDKWSQSCRYLPLWSMRNYFGEKVAFYFAWTGLLISTLWIPMIIGLGVFGYGAYRSAVFIDSTASGNSTTKNSTSGRTILTASMAIVTEACDNGVTPLYALVICVWGTLFLELWKRRSATLAYEWDVDTFEEDEIDRPDFQGQAIKNPVDPGEIIAYYPTWRRMFRYAITFICYAFMVCLVLLVTAGVSFMRVYVTVNYCSTLSPFVCLLFSSTLPSVLNVILMFVLSELNVRLAVKTTNFENHRTQSQYDDAVIVKVFIFEFFNSYTTCFYIAFYVMNQGANGMFGLSNKYRDWCSENNCMSMLTMNLLIFILSRPAYQFAVGLLLPWLQMRHVSKKRAAGAGRSEMTWEGFLQQQYEYGSLGYFPHDCILLDFLDKVIMFGYIMLFAASLPLAPLFLIVTTSILLRSEGYRLLYLQRRPVAFIEQNIGTWYSILDFICTFAVVVNGFLMAFTSRYADLLSPTRRLWLVIIFEIIVFSLKYFLAWCIPDVPYETKLALAKERHTIRKFHAQREKEKLNEAAQLNTTK